MYYIQATLPAINIITALILLAIAVDASWRVLSDRSRSVHLLSIVHFVFCGLPLLLDAFIGKPAYTWPGFRNASDDAVTAMIYCGCVLVQPVIWTVLGTRSKVCTHVVRQPRKNDKFLRRWKAALHVFLVLPVILVAFAPDPSVYLSYAVTLTESANPDVLQYHDTIANATLLSILAAAGLVLGAERVRSMSLYVMPWVLAAAWLNGKRHIVLVALISIALALFRRRALTRRQCVALALVTIGGFSAYSSFYQNTFRSFDDIENSRHYESLRIDFGRDHDVKLAIFSYIYETRPILDYAGQSILFDLTAFVPRTMWPEKPWPFAQYMTSAALGITRQNLGWGVTTSYLDEAIANFGFWGLLIGPAALALFCRIGDSCGDSMVSLLTSVIGCLFLAVQLPAFMIPCIAWALVIAVHKRRLRRDADILTIPVQSVSVLHGFF